MVSDERSGLPSVDRSVVPPPRELPDPRVGRDTFFRMG